ncbi:MAG: HD-GYP domain-containing protein [Candidatus Omnitrophota bacterium]|nr:MAG: HD-GYP domain-containing protein [Candidatus Omnitrophota bacterium]
MYHKEFNRNRDELKGWFKVQQWFIDKLNDTEGALIPMGFENVQKWPKAEKDYQLFLENASRLMIRFKKPEHLIRMIVRIIDEQLGITHTAIILYKEQKNAFVLIDSKGEGGAKIPVGFIRMTFENPLINIFKERKNYVVSENGILVYEDIASLLKNKESLAKHKNLANLIELVLRQMDLLKANLCIPLYSKKDLIGVLILGDKISKEKFTRQEIGFFMTLANDAAMAISNAQLIQNLQGRIDEIKDLYLKEHRIFIHTAIALATAIDARDPYTHGHTERVMKYCLAVADELEGIPEAVAYRNFKETLHISALLHDVGKIGIPDAILNKKGKLTKKEFEKIKEHPVIGAAILTPIKELGDVTREIKYHQERYDGKGYPEGLKGSKIPLIARIIAVCDAFDAIITDRPYRQRKTLETAIQIIRQQGGKQFDPVVVGAFLLAYEKGKILNKK